MVTGDRSSVLRWLVAAGLAPAFLAFGLHAWVSTHTGRAIVIFVMYEFVVVALAFAGKVYAQVEAKWVQRVASVVDEQTTRLLFRYRRKYLKYLAEFHQDVDTGGLTIRAPFGLPVDQVFVDLSLA